MDLTKPRLYNFESAGKDLKSISFKLLTSQNLLKLMYFPSEDALSKTDIDADTKKIVLKTCVKRIPQIPTTTDLYSYVVVIFDHFIPNATNPAFRDNLVIFDVLCPLETWEMDDYMLRPYKMMHEIDTLFNGQKMNGIGRMEFISADSLVLNNDLAGYTLNYKVINDA